MADAYSLKEVKEILFEIISAYIAIFQEDQSTAILKIKKCIRRFKDSYLKDYKLSGSYARVRIKGRIIVGYICSSEESFPLTEAVWKFLHYYRITHSQEYFEDHPREINDFKDLESKCIQEVEKAMNEKPVETISDLKRLTQSFDMMIHLAHLGPDTKEYLAYDSSSFNEESWIDINPWRLPKGKSMLIDYWYNIPTEFRPLGHMVLNRLASSKINSISDIECLKLEVEAWLPDAYKESAY